MYVPMSFLLIGTSTGLRMAPKSLFLLGTVPTDLPLKEILKKTNPVSSYGPKCDGVSRRDSRRSSRFPTNFTKIGLERLRGKISAQFKKEMNPNMIPQVLVQKCPNLGQFGGPWALRSGRKRPRSCFFHRF